MQNAELDEAQPGIKTAWRNINNFRYADDNTFMGESREEMDRFLMKMKEESEKTDLKLNIQNIKIMASSPITSWQIDGETMKTVTDFSFLGSVRYCSHEIKRHLLLSRKTMTKLDSILKSRGITLPTKVCLVKAKEMATHSSILAWKIPWMEEPDGLQSMGSQRVGQTERLHFHFHFLWFFQ